MVKRVNFSNLNTQVSFNKEEPTIYIGTSANKTRIINYLFLGMNLMILIGFFILFYFLDMINV